MAKHSRRPGVLVSRYEFPTVFCVVQLVEERLDISLHPSYPRIFQEADVRKELIRLIVRTEGIESLTHRNHHTYDRHRRHQPPL